MKIDLNSAVNIVLKPRRDQLANHCQCINKKLPLNKVERSTKGLKEEINKVLNKVPDELLENVLDYPKGL